LGIKYKKKSEAGAGKSGGNQSDGNRMKQLKEQNSKYKRAIKALRRSNGNEMNDNDDDSVDIDVGDQFGGKASKKKKSSKD